jgi:tetrahydromethanopterin S-methyltransferase subunit B
MTDEDIKKIERAARDSHTLSENLKSLDFELQQFNQFAHKVKTIRTKGIFIGIFFGVFLGGLLTVFATQSLTQLYVKSETKNMLRNLGLEYSISGDKLMVWSSKQNSTIWANDTVNVLEIKK